MCCQYKIDILFQKIINHFQSNKFIDCNCNDEHKYFAVVCPNCPYNANSLARNYFASTNCYCFAEDKDVICGFCLTLKLTVNIYKICIDKKEELGHKLMSINE